MEDLFRISVRDLVAFSCFCPDILPTAGAEALLTGTLAHKARQAEFEGQTEKSIKHVFEADGASVLVYGRMDAIADGDVPFIEEIKHTRTPPEAPLPEHRAQALCYAAMLALEKPCERVRFSVCYVNLEGEALRVFEEEADCASLQAEMDALIRPYAAWAMREARHRSLRDESLRALAFPFDAYRPGQRELAIQVYTAITRKKRLFASLPTGTGKSAAVLYPALKALGEGRTGSVVYLTARNTARQSPLNAIRRMHAAGMEARCCVLTAKEKLCPAPARCHPDDCLRARGHYLRQEKAIQALLDDGVLLWDEAAIREYADRHQLCPFEFALALSEIADILMMDLNHAFDPFAQIKRLFQRGKHFTLLVDEAHHAIDRVRDSLSGLLDSGELSRIRTEYGKQYGRKNAVYQTLSALIHTLRDLPAEMEEQTLEAVPDGLCRQVQSLLDASIEALSHSGSGLQEVIRLCLPFLYACEHLDEDYAVLLERHGRERTLLAYCLLPGKEIARVTKGLRGAVFFSATLDPLPSMKQLLGGTEEDACFQLPSPFPPEHLAVVRKRVSTRFQHREQTAGQIASAIHELLSVHPGNTIVFFPSYAYLNLVREKLDENRLPRLWVQTRDMGENDREAFLEAFEDQPVLALCVLGGLFSEGIDLPGERLINAVITGVGLPVPSVRLSAVRSCYQAHFGDGFAYACRIPGMQKVLQAAGRVIRSETDRGMVILLDERYYEWDYAALLPREWRLWDEDIARAAEQLEVPK